MTRLLARAWLRLNGWHTSGTIDHKKFVLIAAPHTSNWDLIFMLAVAADMGVRVRWLGKHTLFSPPFGWLFRWLGGIPVDRRSRHNLVEQAAQHLRDADAMILAVPPEGTRKKVEYWKSGFYWIAHQAQVPIALGFLDFGGKAGGVGGYLMPTGDVSKDMDVLRAFYADKRGKHPERESLPRLREEGREAAA
ncbi:MAG: 1-acyl-sn-glycerol-3-phosphate acyltransferase [Myxococcales bacterium]|nr:1-acyl-sn-glycerol-3-phosphate acyltransferase [Myxococcales bacterium]MCB9567982.1 1-acyl-sn-glycerol-3-phosphate acyltransferase [Myxococcales bacterium]MCB9700427.1 1-acyl-sn-glycerol-3-phosphate acyltransferase [Myxococcales bacterium]